MNDARNHAALLTLGERGRAVSEARLLRWAEAHPTEPCTRCFGGTYVERAGKRRPFRSEDFSREAGDRYEASCPACRGAGKTFITPARAEYLRKRKLRDARREYARLRDRVCAEHELEPAHFNRLVGKRLQGDRSPEAYLAGARAVAVFFGTEETGSARR